MTTMLDTKGARNYFYDPDFPYSEGRLPRQPRNRGTTDGNILQLFPKSEKKTFHPSESDDLPILKQNDDRLLYMLNYSSCP